MFEFETEREKYIWLAAWMDTEGNFSLQKRDGSQVRNQSYWLPFMNITNTDRGVIDALRDLTQAAITTVKRKEEHWRDRYVLYFSPQKCRLWIPRIYPFLVIKQRHAELMLEALKLLKDNQRWAGRGKSMYRERIDANFARLSLIHEELRELNARGKGKE
ncbi:MAG TPA: hypothetical protein VKB35_20455 [Ktedonobacteraceae bacterium]|nr:hypothetical protein [Ktedonobacteraceae bacterium]